MPIYAIIIVFILFMILVFLVGIKNQIKSYEPTLTNFNPQEFEYKLDGPVYYSVENKLYYSQSGEINKSNQLIWSGTFSGLQEVSPDSRYISLIDTNQNLFIIQNDGKLLAKFSNFNFSEFDREVETGDYLGNSISWSSNSENLYFLKFSEYYGFIADSNRMELYKYSSVDNSLTEVYKIKEIFWDKYYLSPDEKYLYYETYDYKIDVSYFVKVDLEYDSIIFRYIDSANNNIRLNPDELHHSHDIGDFDQNAYNKDKIIVNFPDSTDKDLVYLIENNSHKLLLEGVLGWHEFKNYHEGYFNWGYFLPGDRYFIAKIESETYSGQLIFDTESGKYMKAKEDLVFYFSIKSNIRIDTNSYRMLPKVRSRNTGRF